MINNHFVTSLRGWSVWFSQDMSLCCCSLALILSRYREIKLADMISVAWLNALQAGGTTGQFSDVSFHVNSLFISRVIQLLVESSNINCVVPRSGVGNWLCYTMPLRYWWTRLWKRLSVWSRCETPLFKTRSLWRITFSPDQKFWVDLYVYMVMHIHVRVSLGHNQPKLLSSSTY